MEKIKQVNLFTILLIFLAVLHSPVEAQRSAQSVQGLFDEAHRPQFHFTPRINWMNDPNGLVYHDGVWHMFFQHNPEGINWGNMTWGHATSPDLIHWTHKDHKLWPDELGTIWSGSAVVDHQNTAGFQDGNDPAIVAIYTYAGHEADPPKEFTQGIAYSLDSGETFIKYEGNPVMDNMSGGRDRDPKVFWHDDSEQWVMVLYLGEGHRFAVYTSPDLKEWTETQILDDEFYEVPELLELPVDGDTNNKKWVFVDVFGDYLLGTFDGERFECTSGRHKGEYGDNFYATQTWDNSPDASGVRNKKSTAPLTTENGTIKLQILIDRTSIEVFGNEGLISMTNNYSRAEDDPRNIGLTLFTREGSVNVLSLEIHKLKTAWNHERNQ